MCVGNVPVPSYPLTLTFTVLNVYSTCLCNEPVWFICGLLVGGWTRPFLVIDATLFSWGKRACSRETSQGVVIASMLTNFPEMLSLSTHDASGKQAVFHSSKHHFSQISTPEKGFKQTRLSLQRL